MLNNFKTDMVIFEIWNSFLFNLLESFTHSVNFLTL